MKTLAVNTIKEYVKILNKRSILETKPQNLCLSEALCLTSKVIPPKNENLPKEYCNRLAVYIDRLNSVAKGSGTRAVKKVVLQSLSNPNTNGRVIVYATKIDYKSYPAGFYYKLGFRSVNTALNEQCENWLKSGGKYIDAPSHKPTHMYLPHENIQHCLNYPNKINLKEEGLKLLV